MKPFFAENLALLKPIDESGPVWLGEIIAAARAGHLPDLADILAKKSSPISAFLEALSTLSPYLRDLITNQPHFLEPLRFHPLEEVLEQIIGEIAKLDEETDVSEAILMRRLRQLKKQAALMIALGDIGQLFDVAATTHWLSLLAEAALGSALRFLLRQAHRSGQIELADEQNPEKDCGFVLLGLGKLGAFELNYSSDIDLIAFIDETAPAIVDVSTSVDVFSRLMRRLVRILQTRTPDGYVFRVDLRLRPDPASTPLALPFGGALNYYESRGQNWERAAFIKARPVAGDARAGAQLLKELEPYIWRKYLDYAAIADIAAIKNQMHKTYPSLEGMTPAGANIKLGCGGIREIEFFVQSQQLIAGGRLPQLRGRSSVAMLAVLCDEGWITPKARDELRTNYAFLRRVEHCIQMVNDEQSHVLPQDAQGFLIIAHLMFYDDAESFSVDLKRVMAQVDGHYRALFAEIVPSEGGEETLNFSGEEADPRTIEALSALGFERVEDIERIIAGWYAGNYRATHASKARACLQQLTSSLLAAIAASGWADATLLQFDAFLRELPAGVQLFSLLQSNKGLLDMLMLIMGSAPRLADIIIRKPHIFDGMLDPTLFNELPPMAHLEQRLELFLGETTNYEEKLDRLRIFGKEQQFLIGLRLLGGSISSVRAGHAFSDLADLMIGKAVLLVAQEFAARHGVVQGGKIAIMALGKLGSRELRAGSDVDLILLYEHDDAFEMSDGDKPLYVAQYYTRLTQRLIAALAAPTAEGVLYQVDMRLRPSGNKGPVAVPFSSFSRYQRHDAWIWEHLALTRARLIAGDEDLCAKIQADIAAILTKPHGEEDLTREIATMRQRIAAEKPAKNIWDLKYGAGGIIELEFIAQYGILAGYVPYLPGQTSGDILGLLARCLCPADNAHRAECDSIESHSALTEAFMLYTDLSQMISLCLRGQDDQQTDLDVASDGMPLGLVERILSLTGQPDVSHLKNLIQDRAAEVHHIFTRLFPGN